MDEKILAIRQPASFCGTVGLKPTYGLVSRYGLVAFASSLDQIGCFTRDVYDCAIVLNHIAGHDAMDSSSAPFTVPDYTNGLTDGISGKHIGIPKQYLESGIQSEVREAVNKAAEYFEKAALYARNVPFR